MPPNDGLHRRCVPVFRNAAEVPHISCLWGHTKPLSPLPAKSIFTWWGSSSAGWSAYQTVRYVTPGERLCGDASLLFTLPWRPAC